ncbi:MAG: hypothetical protein L3J51_05290 [Cocleimonas sp.]|nr:hypothetical protein [Cocleimonas sp.]
MAKKRIFHFDGSEGATEMMVAILNHYADVAFPLGGSDCAAASREALQSISAKLLQAQAEGLDAEINRRQRPMLKSAVTWFYAESEYASPNEVMYDRLLSQFQK